MEMKRSKNKWFFVLIQTKSGRYVPPPPAIPSSEALIFTFSVPNNSGSLSLVVMMGLCQASSSF